jgi:hypothetical protein
MQFKSRHASIGGSIQRQLSSSCGGPDQPDVDRFCSMKALLSAFNGSQSVALPPGTSASDVQFVYEVAQSNESCVEND